MDLVFFLETLTSAFFATGLSLPKLEKILNLKNNIFKKILQKKLPSETNKSFILTKPNRQQTTQNQIRNQKNFIIQNFQKF